MNRRQMLTVSAAALSIGRSRILGANDRVRVGIAGLGWRGADHLAAYLSLPGAEVAGLCDVDPVAVEKFQSDVVRAGHKPARTFGDLRQMFADREIDAVSLVLPNHWHALAAIWAMEAGKDVYCEKPASHQPMESRAMIAAAAKYGRMVQVGSQGRSMTHKREAMELLRGGAIGEIYLARGLCFKRRKSIGHRADSAVPKGINWDLFLGPAPMRPFNELRFKYNWNWFWDTGNGDMGNQGAHQMDVARWGLGLSDTHSELLSVHATGGKLVYQDDQETPNTLLATYELTGKRRIVFEVRGLPSGPESGLPLVRGNTVGNVFLGANGYLAMNDDGYWVYDGETHQVVKERKADDGAQANAKHMGNFLAAVRSRKRGELAMPIEAGAASADLCHFANISYRTGEKLKWSPERREWAGSPAGNALMGRTPRAPYTYREV